MNEPAKRAARYEDLFSLPDNVVGEIIAGELVTHPRPASRHARAASILGVVLAGEFDVKPDGKSSDWWIIDEPECHLGADIVVPDLAGWRKKTMPVFPDVAYFELRPDWVCEVISPSTSKYDRGPKRDIYARAGVEHMWLVDPVDKLIEVFVLNDGHWLLTTTVSDNQVSALPPFESLPFDLSVLWI